MATPPKWILKLANTVAAHLEPMEPMPPLGCHYHQCESGWEIAVFPSQTEIIGGPMDGRHTSARYRLDILAVTNLFSRVDEMSWQSRSLGEDDQLGAHVCIGGLVENETVFVRILETAPACFSPGRKAFTNHGCVIESW